MMKSKFRLLTLFVVMVLCFSSLSVTAFAGGDGETTEPPTITEPIPDPTPLTPEGNLTLVDDIEGDETQGKQFVTLQSKAGNYFYLIIDRDGDKENVYFLNLVDEADLMALIEETPVTPEEVPEPEPTPEPEVTEPVEEQPEESGNPTILMLAVLLIAGICGGAFYYIKFIKNKPDTKGATDLSEYDYDDEDEEDEYEYGYEDTADDEPSDETEVDTK